MMGVVAWQMSAVSANRQVGIMRRKRCVLSLSCTQLRDGAP
jgi:hypothetical protein